MSEQLYFGAAVKNITPQTPLPLAGYFRFRMAKEILDELEVRALLFRQGKIWSAIVQFDLITVSWELVETFYREIVDIAELSPKNMIVTATHTHTAPVVSSTRPGFNPDYLVFAAQQAAEAVREAWSCMAPGEIVVGKTSESRFAFNRRYWMKNGVVMTNPGKLNPDIDRPEGRIDAEIPLLGIRRDGRLKVLIANIVNHADTVGGNCISADWPGFFRRTVRVGIDSDTMVLPLIGASGNINHWDVNSGVAQTSYADAECIGKGYAETVLKAVSMLTAAQSPALTVKQTEVVIPLREISGEELQTAKRTLEKLKDIPDIDQYNASTPEELVGQIIEKYYAKAIVNIAGIHDPMKVNLVGIFLEDACILSLPCEPFVEIGLELKNKIFKEYNVMVVSHSNGVGHKQIGGAYIPNSFNYERGGYETVPRSSPFSVRTADLLIDAWRKLAEQTGQSKLKRKNVFMPKSMKMIFIVGVLIWSWSAFPAFDDEPSELNWENFARNMDVFSHFLRYQSQYPYPSSDTATVCPEEFSVVTITPDAFQVNPGKWQLTVHDHLPVMATPAGHNTNLSRAKLRIDEPGFYRVWVKYYHEKGKHASFGLRIIAPELLHETIPVIVSPQGEYYFHRFDWAENVPKRSVPLPTGQGNPDGFLWESGPLVELGPGEYTIELGGLIHGGPYGGRKIAMIVLTADPLLTGLDEAAGHKSYPASDALRQHWSVWLNRPGAVPFDSLDSPGQRYYRQWRAAFLQKLAENPETDAEKRLAAQSYFDECVNLIGAPGDIAVEKKRLDAALQQDFSNVFVAEIEAETMALPVEEADGWKVKEFLNASHNKILEASYANGPAVASTDLEIPVAGTYWVWVRYLLLHRYYSLFDLEFFTVVGTELGALHYGQPKDRLERDNNQFIWECFSIELPAGKLKLLLNKNIGKQPYILRRVDKIFITDKASFHPDAYQKIDTARPDILWLQCDPWSGFSRISTPESNDVIEPDEVALRVHRGDTATMLLHFRNNRLTPITFEPGISGVGAPQLRLVSYLKTPLYGWSPTVLLERAAITVPPRQNASLWLSFKTDRIAVGDYTPELTIGSRKIKFRLSVIPEANQRPVPIVGGWCPPLEQKSCWELFREIGVNLIFKVVVSKQEMKKYQIKHFTMFGNLFPENLPKGLLKYRERFRDLGLSENDWSVILLDEPKPKQVDKWLELARQVRATVPDIQIWCNPGEVQTSTPEVVRSMRPYIDIFCPYIDHFRAKDQEYREAELPAIGRLKLIYTTPCFKEKSPDSPLEILYLGEMAAKYQRHGWSYFSLFWGYPYSNSVWDEMFAYSTSQCINFYPGAYGRTLSTRNLEAVREAIQRYRKIEGKIEQ